MALFASNGTIEKDYSSPVETVRAAVEAVSREQGHHLGTISQDQTRYELTTQRTALSWGVAPAITLSPSGSGTHVTLDCDNALGSREDLMDGKNNTKTATKFIVQLNAKLRGPPRPGATHHHVRRRRR